MKITQLEKLRMVVSAQVAYWDALRRLETALTDTGFSDFADNLVIECIKDYAVSADTPSDVMFIGNTELAHVKRLAKRR